MSEASKMTQAAPAPEAPFGYYYKSLGGRGVLHVVGEASDAAIAADMAAARDYPTGHKCIPLFTRAQAPAEPAGEAVPAGQAVAMPGTSGFTMAAFKTAEVPVGTNLYTHSTKASLSKVALIRTGQWVDEDMTTAVQNGANSVAMPDELAAGLHDSETRRLDVGEALQQFDRAVAGSHGCFPWVDDDDRILLLIQEAGRAGVTLFWLKSVWAIGRRWCEAAWADYYKSIPWDAPKHEGWKEKYRRLGWVYDFATDQWGPPSVKPNSSGREVQHG